MIFLIYFFKIQSKKLLRLVACIYIYHRYIHLVNKIMSKKKNLLVARILISSLSPKGPMHVYSLTKETNFTRVTVSLISHNMEMQMLMLLNPRMIKDNFLFHLTSAIAPFHRITIITGPRQFWAECLLYFGSEFWIRNLGLSGPVRC